MANALQKWEREKIFAESFMNRLKVTAKDILQKYEEEGVVEIIMQQPQPKSKYSQEFLQDMKDIRMYDITSALYDHHALKVKLQTQIGSLQK